MYINTKDILIAYKCQENERKSLIYKEEQGKEMPLNVLVVRKNFCFFFFLFCLGVYQNPLKKVRAVLEKKILFKDFFNYN